MTEDMAAALGAERRGDIQAVTRAAQILRLVADSGEVRATDVAATLGLQKSTAHRYLSSLAAAGVLTRTDGPAFEPGPIAVHLGAVAMRRSRVLDLAEPFLDALAHETHETVVLSLWGGRGAVVAMVLEDDQQVAVVSVRQGRMLPLDSAQTQVFLAFMEGTGSVESLIEQLPEPQRDELKNALRGVRETGLGEHSNLVQGIHAVATPVFDARGSVAATIALVGTSDGLRAGRGARLAQALKLTGQRISARLGHKFDTARDATA